VLIHLIRHPRPLIEAGICYGQLDIDCEDPQPVARQLASRLPENIPLLSSPLRRAKRLAEALHADVRFDERLAEINFGDWEGCRWESIDRAALDCWAADVLNFVPPGGESVAMLQARAVEFAAELESAQWSQVALVTHAGIMRALLGHLRQLPADEWTRLKFDFGSVTTVEI